MEMSQEDLVDLAERNCHLPQSLGSASADVEHKALSARFDKRRGSGAFGAWFGIASAEQGNSEPLRDSRQWRKPNHEH
jgi:hypothetical protein